MEYESFPSTPIVLTHPEVSQLNRYILKFMVWILLCQKIDWMVEKNSWSNFITEKKFFFRSKYSKTRSRDCWSSLLVNFYAVEVNLLLMKYMKNLQLFNITFYFDFRPIFLLLWAYRFFNPCLYLINFFFWPLKFQNK